MHFREPREANQSRAARGVPLRGPLSRVQSLALRAIFQTLNYLRQLLESKKASLEKPEGLYLQRDRAPTKLGTRCSPLLAKQGA